jgi:hypothetical protein
LNFTGSGSIKTLPVGTTTAANNLTNNTGVSVTVTTPNVLVVGNILTNNGTMTFEDDSSLVQINNVANTGNITYKRTATVADARDYVYWSSPVTGSQTLAALYPFSNNIYRWNAPSGGLNGGTSGNWDPASGTMGLGAGYIVRSGAVGSYTTIFEGVPNNGNVDVTISRGINNPNAGINGTAVTILDDNWNLIGNPYPSAIKATDFITANASNLDSGTVWLWTHGTAIAAGGAQPFYNTFGYNYNTNDYIAYNTSGSVSGPSSFTGNIAAGQSFFVQMKDDTVTGAAGTATVTFNNTMRKDTYGNANFYRTANTNIEKNRIWLDLISSATNEVSRTMVGYIEGATHNKDFNFDSPANYQSSQNLFSKIGNEFFAIQGRSLPFDANDTITMGFIVPTTGNYTIAISEVDGFFANNGQTIYLEDTLLNTVSNLSIAPYHFASVQGLVNNRFVLRYTPSGALSTNNTDYLENNVIVATDKKVLKIKSFTENIKSIAIFDLLGREVYKKDGINNQNYNAENIVSSQQTLIVKIRLANDEVVTQKTIVF